MPQFDDHGHPYHFRLFGFPVHVGWQFFLWPVLIVSSRSPIGIVTWVAVVFVSILVHELGHALAYRAFGAQARISLWGMGGLTYGSREPDRRWKDAVVTLAGPVPPLVLIGLPTFVALVLGVGENSPDLRQALVDIMWVNLFWSVVNLLPILPMDGGRLVQTLAGTAPARITSAVVGVLVAMLALAVGDVFFTVAGLALAGYNIYQYNQVRTMGDPVRDLRRAGRQQDRLDRAAGPTEADLWGALAAGDGAKAVAVVNHLGPAAPEAGVGSVLAATGRIDEAVGWFVTASMLGREVPPLADSVLVDSGALPRVIEALVTSGDSRAPELLAVTHRRLRDRGHPLAAAAAGEAGAGMLSGPDAGEAWLDVARTWAVSGYADQTLAALARAAEHGRANAVSVASDPAFSRLFDDPAFARSVRALG